MKCCENRINWYKGASDNRMQIKLYMTINKTEVLGPYKRYAIWVQGCNKRCTGCISPDAQALDGGYLVSVDDLAADILSVPDIEGITISGGEPFLQHDALCMLIDILRDSRDLGVIIYTGLLFGEIEPFPLTQKCDLVIDGEYIECLNDDKSLRGSSNQNVICVSGRYSDVIDECYGKLGRRVEFVQKNGGFDMIGIPSKSTTSTLFQK